MKPSTKHDLMMVGIGAAVGAVALYLLAKQNIIVITPTAGYAPGYAQTYRPGFSKAPGFSQAGSVCPSCSTMSF